MIEFKLDIQNKKMIPKNLCGIYAIRNDLNGNMYIGSSSNIYNRFSFHYYAIKKGKFVNEKLQKDIDLIGLDKFSFLILEECDDIKDTLKYLECKYIERFGYYNINSVDGKPVYAYDKYGNFIKSYPNIKAAAKDIDGFLDNVRSAIDKRKKSYKGLQWSYIKSDHISPYCIKYCTFPEKSKIIDQFDLNGNFINTYRSIHEASRQTNVNRSNIARALKGQYKQANGYIWRYHEQEN